MNFSRLCSLLCFFALTAGAQPVKVDEISFQRNDTVQGAYHPDLKRQHIFISSRFGSDEVDPSSTLDSVSGFFVSEIVLVYSKYKQSNDFNQARLNKARWSNLLLKYPGLFQSGLTGFRNLCQAGIHNDSVARELTHGFYIYYENRADPEKRAKEIAEISRMMEEMGIDTSAAEVPERPAEIVPVTASPEPRSKGPMRAKDPKACRQPYYGSGQAALNAFFRANIPLTGKQKKKHEEYTAEVRLRLDFNGQIKAANVLSTSDEFIDQIRHALAKMSLWHPAVLNGVAIHTTVRFDLQCTAGGYVRLKGGLGVARPLLKCGKTATDEEIFDFSPGDRKPVRIPAAFAVNDNDLLKNITGRNAGLDSLLLVVDLTGSMGPYIAQVMAIMQDLVEKNDRRVLSIVLFNDGDGKSDRSKKIGKTGGITVLKGEFTVEDLGEAVLRSMKKGNGGDVMENNIEAVLQGLRACRGCRNVMLIADNYATPRDGILLEQVDRPVHWVLCGAYGGINSNYLDLIRRNEGFLHTNKSDTGGLHEMKDGQTVNIAGYNYQLKDGSFRMVEIR